MFYKGIVLLGCSLRQGLEPVGVVGGAHLLGPFLHTSSHGISDAAIQTGTVVNDIDELVIHIGRQVFVHLLTIEHILAEVIRGALRGCFHL